MDSMKIITGLMKMKNEKGLLCVRLTSSFACFWDLPLIQHAQWIEKLLLNTLETTLNQQTLKAQACFMAFSH